MSQAEELLNSINEELPNDITTPLVEEHIVIGQDRFIIVPEPLKRIAVQNDHKVETVTFDCPRYWDEHDLSKMYIYINYLRPDGQKGVYLAKNVAVDEADPNLMHFTWNIGRELTVMNGPISFLVCAIQTDSQGYRKLHWNSEINTEMTISLGLESVEVINEQYPDIITDLLTRMDYILVGDGTVLDKSLTLENFAADAKVVGDKFLEVESAFDDVNKTLVNLQEQITSNDTDIENLQEQITGNDTDIENLQEQITSNDTDIEGINKILSEHNILCEQLKLIKEYNVPSDAQNFNEHVTLILDHKIPKYEKNMIVRINTGINEKLSEEFNTRLFPYFTANGTIDGFTVSGGWAGDAYDAFDGDTTTSVSNTNSQPIIITCPTYINPKTIYLHVDEDDNGDCSFYVNGIKKDDTEIQLFTTTFSKTFDQIVTLDTDEYFKGFKCGGQNNNCDINEFSVESGIKSKIKTNENAYLNINGLGEKLIDDILDIDKYYELIYDGTVFKAREVM